MANKKIFFFHNTDYYHEVFNSQSRAAHRDPEDPRPTFYWFSDSYHNHIGGFDKYIYLFVKNPGEDNIQFKPRHLESGFDSLYRDYLDFLIDREKAPNERSNKGFCEPPILMSHSNIVPDIIALYDEVKNNHMIVMPKQYKGMLFKLFDERSAPIPFNKIVTLTKILPLINQAFPFIRPENINGRFVYEDFDMYEEV